MREDPKENFNGDRRKQGAKPYSKDKPPFRQSFGDRKPPFKKPFDGDRPSFKKPFEKGGRSFDQKPYGKGRGFSEVNTISTFKACVIRLEKISRDNDDGYALEETFLALMNHFPLAVFGYAAANEVSLVFDLSKGEVYGNSVEKVVSIAAGVASVAFTKAMDDGKAHYFCGILIQPFKDKLIAYFEERQVKFGGGLVAVRDEKGTEIKDAPSFSGNYLAGQLKNLAEERKEGFGSKEDKPRSFEDRPRKDFGDRKPREFGDKRSFQPREDYKPRSFEDRPRKDFGDRKPREFGDRPRKDFGDRKPREFGDRMTGEFDDRKPRNFDKDKKEFKPDDRPKAKDKIGYVAREKVGYVSDTSDPDAIKFRSFADVDTTKSKGFLERQAKRDASSKKI